MTRPALQSSVAMATFPVCFRTIAEIVQMNGITLCLGLDAVIAQICEREGPPAKDNGRRAPAQPFVLSVLQVRFGLQDNCGFTCWNGTTLKSKFES